MATPIVVNQSTTLVQVDTSVVQEYIVRLSSLNTPGSLVTIRDITGGASATNPINISTTKDVIFLDGGGVNKNLYKITQPYGFITVTPKNDKVWGVLNTFGFPDASAAANINNLTATSVTAKNSYLDNAIISTALISTLSTDNVFIRANLSVGQSTIAHAGFYTCTVRALHDMITAGTLYAGSTVSSVFANITSTLTVPYISTQNINIYGVLRSASTISTMGPLFVGSSISTTGNLAVGGSTFVQGELKVLQNVTFQSSLSTLYSLGVGREAMFYSSLSVKDNILTNGHLSTLSNANIGGSLSVMKSAFFTGQVSTQSNLTVGGALSVMSSFYTYGNAVLNSSLYVRSEISTLSNVYIASSLSVGGDLAVYGDIFFNDRLLDLDNLTVQSSLLVKNNISTYSSIVAGQFLRIMGSTFLMGPVSTLSNMTIGGGLSTMKDLAVTGTAYFQSNVVIQSSLSTVGHMNVFGFLSTLSSATIGHSLQVGRDLSVLSSLTVFGSTLLQSSVYITGSLSVFSSIAVSCNLDIGGKLTVQTMTSENLEAKTFTVTNQQNFVMTINSSTLSLGLFSTLGGMNVGGAISTMNSLAVGSTINTQFITVRQNLSTIGNACIGSSIFALSNIQSGASTIVDGGFYVTKQAFLADSVRMKNVVVDETTVINGVTTINNATNILRTLTVNGGVNITNNSGQQGQNVITNDTYMSSLKVSSIINYNFQSTFGPAAFFSSMQIQGHLSVFSTVAAACNADVGALLTASSIVTRTLQVSTLNIVQQSNFTLNVSSSTLHAGLFSTSGEIFSGRLISTMSSLAVGDNVNFYKNLTVGGNTIKDGILQVKGATTLSNILQVANATTLSNTLQVAQATTLSNTLAVAQAATLSNTLRVDQGTTLTGKVGIGAPSNTTNALYVNGTTWFNGNIGVQADTNIYALNVNGTVFTSSILAISTTLQSNLFVPNIYNSSLQTSSILASSIGAVNITTNQLTAVSSLTQNAYITNLYNSTIQTSSILVSSIGARNIRTDQITTVSSLTQDAYVTNLYNSTIQTSSILVSSIGARNITTNQLTTVSSLTQDAYVTNLYNSTIQTSSILVSSIGARNIRTDQITTVSSLTQDAYVTNLYNSTLRTSSILTSTVTTNIVSSGIVNVSSATVGTLTRLLLAGNATGTMYLTRDYGSTYSTGVASGLTALNAVKTNGKIMVAVGSATTGLPIFWSSDGITWTRSTGTSALTGANDLIWTGTQFVAVGSVFATSPNGIDSWTTVTVPTSALTTATTTAKSVAFNGSYYVIASAANPSKIYKYDPALGTTEVTTAFTSINKVFWTGSVWLIGGAGSYNLVSYTGGNVVTQITYPTDTVRGIASDGETIVAVGGVTVSYSGDGVTWSAGSNPFSPATAINDVIWDGTNFVAFFTGGNKFARSLNGVTWTNGSATTNDFSRGVAFTYSAIQTLANNGLLTTDSISTTGFVTIGDSLRVGQSTLVVQDSTRTLGVNCNSPSYQVDVNGIINAKFIYQNGAPYQPPPTTGAVTIPNLTVSTLTAGTSASIINTTVPNLIVLVGQITPGSASRLYTGTTPTNMTLYSVALTGGPVALNAAYYTGTSWYMGGKGPSSALLYSSPDSTVWSLITPGVFPNSAVNAIVYNGSYYLVCGSDTTATAATSASRSIVKSTDMNTFTASSTTAGALAFTSGANAAAWNGTLWVAVGSDVTLSSPITYVGSSIKYSYDGVSWYPTMNSFGAAGLTASIGYTVVWNGEVFVAGGTDTNCTLKYSTDGIVWYNCKGSYGLNPTKIIAWSGKRFVAVQAVYAAGSNIFYSDDGITWFTAQQSISNGASLVWTGTQFILGTTKSAAVATMFSSTDGIYWTAQAPTVAYDTALVMNSLAYSSNTIPDLKLANTSFFSKQPQTQGSANTTNTVLSLSNALLINNLYSETSGKVGVNCNAPQVALEVNGFSKFNNTLSQNVWMCMGSNTATTKDGLYASVDNGATWSLAYTYPEVTSLHTALCWDGKRWLAMGNGATVLISPTGFDWTSITTGLSASAYATKVIWTGTYYVATRSSGSNVRSLDGITWTSATGFTGSGFGIAYNGRMLVATGTDTTTTSRIKYSTDQGATWTNSLTALGGTGRCVATNGKIWLVGYDGGIVYSSDSINYTIGTTMTICYDIAWNGRVFVAVGSDTTANIRYSYDGINWTNANLFTGSTYFTLYGEQVTWNGSLFIAVGRTLATGGASLYKSSPDGITWTNMAPSGVPSANARAIMFSSNVTPDFQVENLGIYGKGQVPTTSTNTIALGPSTMVLNNTVTVLPGFVGVNCNAPSYPLDVKGDINTSGYFRGDGSLLTNLTIGGTSGGSVSIPGINNANGRVAINKTSAPTYPLEVNGDILCSNLRGNNNFLSLATSGNVGINKLNPTSALDVTGNTNITGTLAVSLTTTLTGNVAIKGVPNSSNALLVTGSQSNTGDVFIGGTTTMVASSNTGTLGVLGTTTLTGNVAIKGVPNGSNALLVTGSQSNTGDMFIGGTTTMVASSNTGTLGVSLTTTLSGNVGIKAAPNTSNALLVTGSQSNTGAVFIGGTTRVTGNVGIGKDPTTYALDVSGDINTTTFFRGDGRYLTNVVATSAASVSIPGINNANGNVAINKTTAGNYPLDVNGDISCSNLRGNNNFLSLVTANRVGVNCNSPLKTLDVDGTLNVSQTATFVNTSNAGTLEVTGNVGIKGAANTSNALFVTGSQSNTGAVFIGGTTRLTGIVGVGKDPTTGIALDVSGTTLLGTQGSTDRVGVNCNSPRYNLDVNGTLNVAQTATFVNTSNAGTLGVAGNVGIKGAPNTSNALFVTGSQSNTGAVFIGGTTRLTGIVGVGKDPTTGIALDVSGTTLLGTQGSADRVGVNCNSPGYNLDVNGTLNVGQTATFANTSNAGTLRVTQTTRLDGNVGIGKDPTNTLDVNGDINFTGTLKSNGAAVSFGAAGINSSGNVGINKAATTYALDVSGDTNIQFAGPVVPTPIAFVGSGVAGPFTAGTGLSAILNKPLGCAVVSGVTYVVNASTYPTICQITSGVVTLLAGSISASGFVDGTGSAATFTSPRYITYSSVIGGLLVGDALRIRKVTTGGIVTSLFTHTANVYGICVDSIGNVYFSDETRKVYKLPSPYTTATLITTLANDGYAGCTADSQNNIYFTDYSKIIKITSAGAVTTFAGGTAGYLDGQGISAQFSNLTGITCDTSGNLYVTDRTSKKIRKITSAGLVTTIANCTEYQYDLQFDSTNQRFLSTDYDANILYRYPITDTTINTLKTNCGSIYTNTMYIGGPNGGAQSNYIRFYGTGGDKPSEYKTSVIGENIYVNGTSIESSELVIFKANNGDDRVRVLASGGFQVDLLADTAYWPDSSPPPVPTIAGAFIVASGGNVGIGTISPGYKLDVRGDIYSSGNVTAYSDVRAKENIVTIDSPLDKIMKMRGVYYTRKDATQIQRKRQVGVIAQEIEEVLPEVVMTDETENKNKSVAYGNIVALLIEGMKAQQSTIDFLLTRI